MIFSMASGPLSRIVRQNLRRNVKHFLLSGFGIMVGTASFVFFLGLSGGVKKVVLGDIFPIDRVEVISPKTTITGVPRILGDELVQKILDRPEVKAAYPKMKLAFPAKGSGRLFGADLYFPLGGFLDGVEPALLEPDGLGERFKDWEAEAPPPRCDPGARPPVDAKDKDGHDVDQCSNLKLKDCAKDSYCGWDAQCHHRVPVLVSQAMIELYNGSFAPSHGLKPIGAVEQSVAENMMKSLKFQIELGHAQMAGVKVAMKERADCVSGQLVGISRKAIQVGLTVPIGYIRRWNAEFVSDDAARHYSSIVVDVKHKDDVAGFVKWVKNNGYEQEDSYTEELSSAIFIVTLLFLVISFVIIGISAVNISHTFFMLISERRREIGILRAIGATRGDVRKIILGEAALIGVGGGLLGIGVGVGAAKLIDFLSSKFVRDFPFKPTTYFEFTPALIGGALGFAIAFCVLGAFLPARKAAGMQPAQALST